MLTILSNLTGAAVNALAILLGGLPGLMFRKQIPEKISGSIMTGLGLCVVVIGVSGSLQGKNTLILVLSTVIGIIIGELLRLDERMDRLGLWAQNALTKNEEGKENKFAQGFVTASLLFCIGSMAVLGSVESGVGEGFSRHTTLFVKSAIDCVSAMVFASQLGVGVLFSAFPVLLYQGILTVLASLVGSFLSAAVVAEMTCTGSMILIAIGANMIGITKIKTVNFVPAIFVSAALTALAEFFGIYAF